MSVMKTPAHQGSAASNGPKRPPPLPFPVYQPRQQQAGSAAAGASRPDVPPAAGASPAAALLKIQADAIDASTVSELAFVAANSPRTVMRAQQIVVLQRDARDRFRVRAVSSLAHIDRASPTVLWFESFVELLAREHGAAQIRSLPAASFDGGYQKFGKSYPLSQAMWLPWVDRQGQVVGGMLLLRTTPWTEVDAAVGKHLALTLTHAWVAMTKGTWARPRMPKWSKRTKWLAAAVVVGLLLLPVPMTALAPVEVAPKSAQAVTPGIEGVVKAVLVEPNERVKKGQPLVQLVDIALRNRFKIAEREVAVAQTKYKRAMQSAFVDARGRHELGLARSELALKIAERDYAFDMLSRTVIRASADGVAFFGDKRDLVGRPVAVGERLMEIARLDNIEFRIDLGVSDAIVLNDGARVRVFLDSAPLSPISATLVRAAYRAQVRENQQLAYRLVAEAGADQTANLRLGVRGTAQVYGDLVPLAYYLLRRPIAMARQWLGL
ncbi:MAG: HlyD family efflux transporter periplasmic adaptor subunit [Hyphomicrobiaceae bacterium]|nr:HlyD family efflux transporter periplasmic adaptor subunit [Hyphomicrobiaceae bacterium]